METFFAILGGFVVLCALLTLAFMAIVFSYGLYCSLLGRD